MYWDRHLPMAIEAFWYAGADSVEHIRGTHAAFLQYYGLTPEETPLLEYSCSQSSPPSDREDKAHACWTDVS